MAALRTVIWLVCLFSGLSLAGQLCAAPSNNAITQAKQLEKLIDCDTLQGDITVSGIEDSETSKITLDLQTIDGSLAFDGLDDSKAWAIDFPKLTNTNGSLSFRNLKLDSFPQLQGLQTVDSIVFDNVDFSAAKEDGQVVFGDGGQFVALSSIRSLQFTNCIGLTGIGPIESESYQVSPSETNSTAFVVIQGNQDLTNVTLNGYQNVVLLLDVENNNQSPAITTDMHNGSLQLSQVSDLKAPYLERLLPIQQSGSFISQSSLQTLSLDSLQTFDGDFSIKDNIHLSNLSFPSLLYVSKLEIIDNSALRTANLSSISTLATEVDIAGPIEKVFFSQNLDGAGTVRIQPQDPSVCSHITLPSENDVCVKSAAVTTSTPKPSASSNTGHSSGGLSMDAKIGIGVGVGVGVPLILGMVFFLVYRNRKSSKRHPRNAAAGEYPMSEKPGANRPPGGYKQVAVSKASADDDSPRTHQRASSDFGDWWTPPDQAQLRMDDQIELEEQQGMRHEMDARSLPDMDIDDGAEETRSLQDIERAHGRIS